MTDNDEILSEKFRASFIWTKAKLTIHRTIYRFWKDQNWPCQQPTSEIWEEAELLHFPETVHLGKINQDLIALSLLFPIHHLNI